MPLDAPDNQTIDLWVVGLGNPGARYADTRHNIGFVIIDMLADRLAVRDFHLEAGALVADARTDRHTLVLCKPQTYMNRSGDAVAELGRRRGLDADRLLVVCDDAALPVGTLRLRTRGSSGGQNGLQSIIDELGTTSFARLRCGVGSPRDEQDLVDHVLGPFSADERDPVAQMVTRAGDAVLRLLEQGIERTMNIYNTHPTTSQDRAL